MKDPLGTHEDFDDLPKRAEDPPPLPDLSDRFPWWVGVLILIGLCAVMGTCAAIRF